MFEKGSYLDLLRDTEGRLLVTPGNFVSFYGRVWAYDDRYFSSRDFPLRFSRSRTSAIAYGPNQATRLLMNDHALELQLLRLAPSASFTADFRGFARPLSTFCVQSIRITGASKQKRYGMSPK